MTVILGAWDFFFPFRKLKHEIDSVLLYIV